MPQWVQAWRHIATVVRSVSGAHLYNTWNPCVASWSAFDISTGYPGDDVVDVIGKKERKQRIEIIAEINNARKFALICVIGLDIYSPVWPGDLYEWQYSNGTMAKNLTVWCESSVNREHYWSYPGANQWTPTSLGGVFAHSLSFFPLSSHSIRPLLSSPIGWGMVLHLQFAKQHNKPIAFCESGVGLNPSYPLQGIADDGAFPT